MDARPPFWGGSIKRNGIYGEMVETLQGGGKNIVEFGGIMANPTYAKVLEGAKSARENHVDVILAVGGGSVMDCCKAVSLAAKYDGDIWTDFWQSPESLILTLCRCVWLLQLPEPAVK